MMRERVARWWPLAARVLVALLIAIPAVEFCWIASQRLFHPLELEWMEGEMALHSMRWVEERSIAGMYPMLTEDDFVPQLYPPLFQVAAGSLWEWLGGGGEGVIPLWWGRLVSLVAVALTLGAIVLLVREAARSWIAGLAGASAYLAFFRVSGFWYDLYRVDSLAIALAAWSMWFAVRRDSGVFSLAASFLLAVAAAMTKQPAALLPVLAWGVRVSWEVSDAVVRHWGGGSGLLPRGGNWFRHRKALPIGVALALAGTANFLVLVRSPAWDAFHFYVVEMAAEGLLLLSGIRTRGVQEVWQFMAFPLLIPAVGAWASLLARRWHSKTEAALTAAAGLITALCLYSLLGAIAAQGESWAGREAVQGARFADGRIALLVISSWHEPIRAAAALLGGALAILAIRWTRHRTVLPGAWWLLVLLAVQHVAVLSWVKLGGYANSLMPLLFVMAVVLGLGFAWLREAARRAFGPKWGFAGAAAFVLIAAPGWWGTRELALAFGMELHRPLVESGAAEARRVPFWVTDGLRAHRTITVRPAPDQPYFTREEPFGNQIPQPESREAAEVFLDRLRALGEEGTVYIPNQNYLAALAGLGGGPSASALREVNNLDIATPDQYLDPIRAGQYRYLLLMFDLDVEWLPAGMREAIGESYEYRGVLLRQAEADLLRPVTGARVIPRRVYEFRGAIEPESE